MSPPFDPDDFWQFSLATYARAYVADRLLALQDQYQVNINLALLAYYCDVHKCVIGDAQWRALKGAAESFDAQILHPFRQLRRGYKSHSQTADPVIYEQFKALELRLERQQQSQLLACIAGDELAVGDDSLDTSANDAANLHTYLRSRGVRAGEAAKLFEYLARH